MSYLDADTISVKFPCRVKAEVKDKEEESPDIRNNSRRLLFISLMLIKRHPVMYRLTCVLYSKW